MKDKPFRTGEFETVEDGYYSGGDGWKLYSLKWTVSGKKKGEGRAR